MQSYLKQTVRLTLIGAALVGAACQPPTTNVNVTTNTNVNSTANFNSLNANAPMSNANLANAGAMGNSAAVIETKEPEQYQAVVTMKVAAAGASNMASPPIKANVARMGGDRRMEFNLPNGEKLVYLDVAGKQFVISPNRKQYAELNKESIGVDPRSFLMPEQIVKRVQAMKGVERVGEEKVGDRDAIKYQYGAKTDTQSKAGTVDTDSYILVDKETGLPLRSVTNSMSENGSVQGIKGISVVTEMTDIKTTADAALFAEPTDYKKVAPEEIRGQINMVFSAAAAMLGQLMNSGQAK